MNGLLTSNVIAMLPMLGITLCLHTLLLQKMNLLEESVTISCRFVYTVLYGCVYFLLSICKLFVGAGFVLIRNFCLMLIR